jgi:NADPH:quinone reductase
VRAFAVRSFGEPASVQNLPVPAVDDAVLVRVRFAGVNPLDSNAVDVIDAVHAAHPDGVDAVLDLFNGPDAIRRDAEVIRPGGRLVSTIFAADEGWFAQRQITAHNHASSANPLISPQGLTTVGQLLADGTITARITSTVDLDAAGPVLEKLRQGGLRGKAVIRL